MLPGKYSSLSVDFWSQERKSRYLAIDISLDERNLQQLHGG